MAGPNAHTAGLVKGAAAELSGYKEAAAFLLWMSGPQKRIAIRKGYVIATKGYRKELQQPNVTPRSGISTRVNAKGKKAVPLWKTVSFAPKKKNLPRPTVVSPLWVGHLVRRGAYHQHLVVDGTKAWKQDGSTLARSVGEGSAQKNAGTNVRLKTFRYLSKTGLPRYGKKRKATSGDDYVSPVAKRHKTIILDKFGDSFIKGMRKEARSAKYHGYLSY
jgi:hypothetical protein